MKIKEFKGNHILSTVIIAFLCVSTVFTVMFIYAKRETRKELEKAATTQEIQTNTSEQLNPNIKSGTIGDNIYWESNFETSTLTLSGSGIISDTIDYSELSEEERDRLSNLVIENGISGFDNNSKKTDDLYKNFNSISYPDSFTDDIISGKVETHVSKNNPNYSTDSCGVLYNKDKTKLVVYPGKNRKDIFSVPDSVEIIGANSIETEKIKKIFIGKNVKKIESGNFLAYEEYGDYIYMASEIYYEGSREEWETINAENETLSDLDENKIHFNSKRFAEPPTTTSVPPTTKRQSIFDLF